MRDRYGVEVGAHGPNEVHQPIGEEYKMSNDPGPVPQAPKPDPLATQKNDLALVAYSVFVVFVGVVIAVWILVILSLAKITTWPGTTPAEVLILLATTIAVVCLFMWVFHHLQIIRLGSKTENRIWVAFIGAVLSAVAAAIAAIQLGK
jgi:heme/copper-type cytochrome/quinol oxidase subunit 2